MRVEENKQTPRTSADNREEANSTIAHAPRPLTFAENMVMTAKVLAGAVVIGGLIWAVEIWTSSN